MRAASSTASSARAARAARAAGSAADSEDAVDEPGASRFARFTRALGARELPPVIAVASRGGERFERERTLQHSFFAATGVYVGHGGERLLHKVGREASLFGLPLRFVGRMLARRELALYAACAGIEGVPQEFEPAGDTGLVRPFIAGHPLVRGERVGDDFFPALQRMLAEIHARDVAFVDLQKCENVLVGDDGRPHLFDFQASWRLPPRAERRWLRLVPERLLRYALARLQESDRFHVLKHWRRCRPDTISPEALASTSRPSRWIRAHRTIHGPWRALRRLFRRDDPPADA
jgi:hypothetical protein